MPIEVGRNLSPRGSGVPIQLISDGLPIWHAGSCSLDWTTVVAVGVDTTIPIEGLLVPNGSKYLRYGQVLTRITNPGAFVVTITGTPAGGSFVLSIYDPTNYGTYNVTIPYNAAVAAEQTLVDAAIGPGRLVVSGGGAYPGAAHTYTAAGNLLGITLVLPTANSAGLTGGSSPLATPTLTRAGTSFGKYGPYDPGASDGRQTLNRGECGLLNETLLETGPMVVFSAQGTAHPGMIVGGRVWFDRLLQSNLAAHSLALGPTRAELEAAFPELRYHINP